MYTTIRHSADIWHWLFLSVSQNMIGLVNSVGKAKPESTAKNTHKVMSQDGLSKQKETRLISYSLAFQWKNFQSPFYLMRAASRREKR